SHAAPAEDIAPLANFNIAATEEIAEHIVAFCADGTTWEELLYNLFEDYGLEMTHQQYVLIGSTVRSYLSYLKESGRLEVRIEGKRVMWYAV
ncbi:MAG: MBL fold metallo-hydrolase, partial [Oscillospiraceae bacterium]|nr:MBL fold metallo-hydrolase [Oscillospiraceae bacterium]